MRDVAKKEMEACGRAHPRCIINVSSVSGQQGADASCQSTCTCNTLSGFAGSGKLQAVALLSPPAVFGCLTASLQLAPALPPVHLVLFTLCIRFWAALLPTLLCRRAWLCRADQLCHG